MKGRNRKCATEPGRCDRAHLPALHHRGQQTHVEFGSRRPDVVFGSHQFNVLSAGQVRTEGH